MCFTTQDITFLEEWCQQTYSLETKDRLKEIFSRTIDQSNPVALTRLVHLFKGHVLPPELPSIIATIPFHSTLLEVQRVQSTLTRFEFHLKESRKTRATIYFEKQIDCLTCWIDVEEEKDPFEKGDRPFARLLIRLIKEIFKRSVENQLVIFVRKGHVAPVIFAEGFFIQDPDCLKELETLHQKALETQNKVAKYCAQSKPYQASLFRSFELKPPFVIKGDFSLL